MKGHAEILNPDKYQGLMTYTDADLARDLRCRRSVSSDIVEYNGTAVAWGSHKQTVPGTCTNITETTSIYKGVKRTLEIRRFLESMNDGVSGPTPIFEDNQATIVQIKKDRLAPHIRQLDMVLAWLHYQYVRGTFSPLYIVTTNTKGDMNTKSHGGETLVVNIFSIVVFTFYPPPSSLQATIVQIKKDRLAPHIRQLDMILA